MLFFGKFPESNKPRASSKSLKRTSVFHEITGRAPISQKVGYDRFCNYYYYYFKICCDMDIKIGSQNFREPQSHGGTLVMCRFENRSYTYLRTAVYQFRFSGTDGTKKPLCQKSSLNSFLPSYWPQQICVSRACTKPKRTPEPLPNLRMEPNLAAGFLSSLPATTRMFHPGSTGHSTSNSQYIRGSSSPQEPGSQILGAEGDEAAALYIEVCYSL